MVWGRINASWNNPNKKNSLFTDSNQIQFILKQFVTNFCDNLKVDLYDFMKNAKSQTYPTSVFFCKMFLFQRVNSDQKELKTRWLSAKLKE